VGDLENLKLETQNTNQEKKKRKHKTTTWATFFFGLAPSPLFPSSRLGRHPAGLPAGPSTFPRSASPAAALSLCHTDARGPRVIRPSLSYARACSTFGHRPAGPAGHPHRTSVPRADRHRQPGPHAHIAATPHDFGDMWGH
jgi:hypothetical protein